MPMTVDAILALLYELEWRESPDQSSCPICDGVRPYHRKPCRFVEAIVTLRQHAFVWGLDTDAPIDTLRRAPARKGVI